MMVMTAKLNLKKILLILTAAAAILVSLILFLGGSPGEKAAPALTGNEARVKFLRDLGWDVSETPTESSLVKVPKTTSQLYERYNNLQKSQGYDLTRYAGKKVMRHVYQISNYPGSTDPVYATILTYEDVIIGGDITDTGSGGKIRGFQRINTPIANQKSQTAPHIPGPTEESAVPSEADTSH